MNIRESNKLISEFMGLKENENFKAIDKIRREKGLPAGDPMYDRNGVITNLQYHFSWDWLMPVVEKIDSSCFMGLTWCHIKTNGTCIEVYDISTDKPVFQTYPKKNTQEATKLSTTYKAVVRYIEWYNENN